MFKAMVSTVSHLSRQPQMYAASVAEMNVVFDWINGGLIEDSATVGEPVDDQRERFFWEDNVSVEVYMSLTSSAENPAYSNSFNSAQG